MFYDWVTQGKQWQKVIEVNARDTESASFVKASNVVVKASSEIAETQHF